VLVQEIKNARESTARIRVSTALCRRTLWTVSRVVDS